MKRLVSMLAVVFLGSVILINGIAEASSYRPSTPTQIVARYFELWSYIHDDITINIAGLVPKEGTPIIDNRISLLKGGLTDEQYEKIEAVWDSVVESYRGVVFDFEDVIADLNNEMQSEGYDVPGFYKALESEFDSMNKGIGKHMLSIILGEGWNAPDKASSINSYYHIVRGDDGLYRTVYDENFEQPIYDFMLDWYISARLMGASESDIFPCILKQAFDFVGEMNSSEGTGNAIKDYLGIQKYDGSNWAQASTVLFSADQCHVLAGKTAGRLISDGYGYLVYEMEALLGKKLFEQEFLPNGSYKLTVNETITKDNALALLNKRMELSSQFSDILSKYYGRELSVLDPIDAGIYGGAIDGVFWIVRDNYYNPVTKEWKKGVDYEEAFTEATAERQRLYEIALDIKPDLEKAIGYKLAIENIYTNRGKTDRVLLESVASKVLAFQKYGLSANGAVKAFRELLDFSNAETKGSKLKQALVNFYRIADPNRDSIDFTDFRERSAYIGMTDLVASVLSRPDYFGITARDFDAAFNKSLEIFSNAAPADPVNNPDGQDLAAMLTDTYQISKWDVSKGIYAGTYSFWAQVLSAKGRKVVQEQLDARKTIYQALKEKTASFVNAAEEDKFEVVLAFEAKLGGLQGDALTAKVNSILKKIILLDSALRNVGDVIDSISEPPEDSLDNLYPRFPQVKDPIDLGAEELLDDSYAINSDNIPVAPIPDPKDSLFL